jgi:hypothetical protein
MISPLLHLSDRTTYPSANVLELFIGVLPSERDVLLLEGTRSQHHGFTLLALFPSSPASRYFPSFSLQGPISSNSLS